MSTVTVPSSAYLRAIQIVDERGWCQASRTDDAGRVSIVGAVLAALGLPLHPVGEYTVPEMVQLDQVVTDLMSIVGFPGEWNDEPGRTVDEVKAALADAARWAGRRKQTAVAA